MRTREVKADFKLAFVGVLVEFSCTHAITTYVLCYKRIKWAWNFQNVCWQSGLSYSHSWLISFLKNKIIYRISSYKTLPQIIPAFLKMPAPGILLCRWNLVIFNNTRSWRPYEKIVPAGLIWGNTVICSRCSWVCERDRRPLK